jgi:hypothetical protein
MKDMAKLSSRQELFLKFKETPSQEEYIKPVSASSHQLNWPWLNDLA